MPNLYLDVLLHPSFQGLNRLFVLLYKNIGQWTSYEQYFLPTVKIKDYNVMIDGRNFFDQSVKNDWMTYDNIQKIATGQGDDYTTGCIIYYPYFEKYKLITIDLGKQQELDADRKAIQQVNFTKMIERDGNTTMLFIIEEAKQTNLGFSGGTVRVL